MGRTRQVESAAAFGKNDLPEFAKGDDVGHGVDHDCMQCRTARAAMAKMNLHTSPGTATEGVLVNETGTGILQGGDGAPASSDPNDRSAPVETLTTMPLREPEPVERIFSGESHGPFDSIGANVALLDDELDVALAKILVEGGVIGEIDGELLDEYSEVEILDALLKAFPSLGVMVMRGYVIDDPRWHVEFNRGGTRVLIKDESRERAVKLAALSLFDGAEGMKLERAFAARYRESQAHFSGITQANV